MCQKKPVHLMAAKKYTQKEKAGVSVSPSRVFPQWPNLLQLCPTIGRLHHFLIGPQLGGRVKPLRHEPLGAILDPNCCRLVCIHFKEQARYNLVWIIMRIKMKEIIYIMENMTDTKFSPSKNCFFIIIVSLFEIILHQQELWNILFIKTQKNLKSITKRNSREFYESRVANKNKVLFSHMKWNQ
jgi:hypothetical protein